MMEDMAAKKQCKTRNCLKFLPLDTIFKADLEELKANAKKT